MKRYLQLLSIVLVLGLSVTVFARDENGVETNHFNYSAAVGQYADHYVAYNPTSTTFISNSLGESDLISGSIDVRGYKAKRHIEVLLTTLGSASITMKIEGRSSRSPAWGLIFEKVYTSAGADIFNILEGTDFIKISLKVATNGTDEITIIGQYHSSI
jgi:hypothetical protein